jgi:hypothetical protein
MGGRRGWAVSAGVLAVLGAVLAVGASVIGRGGGAHGVTSAGSPVTASGTRSWTASTLRPGLDGEASPEARAPSPAASSGVLPSSTSPGTSPPAPSPGVSEEDRRAGVMGAEVVQAGTGRLLVVPGSVPAPNTAAPRMRVRVEVEEGVGAGGEAFARFVMDTLNDARSWGHGGRLSFARTDGKADFRVVLASPDTSAKLCAPLRTGGTLSCGGPGRAVITMYRFVKGIPDYKGDITGYRHYVINHEVGHVLGHGHAYCDPGHLAPVMVQQTKGLHGCLPNPWPFPVQQ